MPPFDREREINEHGIPAPPSNPEMPRAEYPRPRFPCKQRLRPDGGGQSQWGGRVRDIRAGAADTGTFIIGVWRRAIGLAAAIALALSPCADGAAPPPASGAGAADLENLFRRPPGDARPGAFWQWMNGNVTKEGITADFEAMRRAGISLPLQFSIGMGVPEGSVGFGTGAYFDMLEHAAAEAKRVGIQIGLMNADSWTGSGGPWITPDLSMHRLAFAETRVQGPGRIAARLPKPAHAMDYYRDLAVFAVACPEGTAAEDPMAGASLRSNVPGADAANLLGSESTPAKGGAGSVRVGMEPVWFEIDLARPAAIRSVEIRGSGGQMPACRILVGEEGGRGMRLVRESAAEFWAFGGKNHEVFAFPPVRTAKVRVELSGSHGFTLTGLRAGDVEQVEDWPGKAMHVGFCEIEPGTPHRADTPPAAPVIGLLPKLNPDGVLEWDAPAGVWRVVRLGCTTTARQNAPATRLGVGLECDKLSKRALERHFESYVARCLERFGDAAGPVAAWVLSDSWEIGEQNWTPDFPAEFQRRRGYDMSPFLPALAGAAVGSLSDTDRFLWDFRRTISEMVAENYYGHMAALAGKRGLRFAAEPYTVGADAMGFDHLRAACAVDMPMTEFWTGTFKHVPVPEEQERLPNHFHETKQMTSAAHAMGKRWIGAEAFTAFAHSGRWTNHPWSLKQQGDRMFCLGVNRFILHCFVHQPWLGLRPGATLDNWGESFDRNNTWFEPGVAWFEYLARCQALLQAGVFAADVAYFPGDHGPHLEQRLDKVGAAMPPGHDWDAVPGHLLLEAAVESGEIVLPSGMRYRLLALNDIPLLTAPMAEALRRLVLDGACVLGPRPAGSPSLADKGAGDARVASIASELWGAGERGSKKTGKGTVFWGVTVAEALAAMGIEPDCATSQDSPDPMLKNWIHRRAGGADLYFVRNTRAESASLHLSLRASGKRPELWWPDSGRIEPAPLWRAAGGRTELDVALPPLGSVFVVLRKPVSAEEKPFVSVRGEGLPEGAEPKVEGIPGGVRVLSATGGRLTLVDAAGGQRTVEVPAPPAPLALAGPWKLDFPKGKGAPGSVQLPGLASWTEHEDAGVRHFSGTATYRLEFDLPEGWSPKDPAVRYVLDLGDVRHLAAVRLNGAALGTLWKPPFQSDAAGALRPGRNELEIEVTNLWVNRLIGDEFLPDDCQWNGTRLAAIPEWLRAGTVRPSGRIAFATYRHWTKEDALVPSGLLGPVVVRPLRVLEVRQ